MSDQLQRAGLERRLQDLCATEQQLQVDLAAMADHLSELQNCCSAGALQTGAASDPVHGREHSAARADLVRDLVQELQVQGLEAICCALMSF